MEPGCHALSIQNYEPVSVLPVISVPQDASNPHHPFLLWLVKQAGHMSQVFASPRKVSFLCPWKDSREQAGTAFKTSPRSRDLGKLRGSPAAAAEQQGGEAGADPQTASGAGRLSLDVRCTLPYESHPHEYSS